MTQPFLTPKKNFDYINRVNKTNLKYILFYISSLATLKKTFAAKYSGVLPSHPK